MKRKDDDPMMLDSSEEKHLKFMDTLDDEEMIEYVRYVASRLRGGEFGEVPDELIEEIEKAGVAFETSVEAAEAADRRDRIVQDQLERSADLMLGQFDAGSHKQIFAGLTPTSKKGN